MLTKSRCRKRWKAGVSSSQWDWASQHPLVVLIVSVLVGLLVSSPYVAHLIYVRRQRKNMSSDAALFSALAPHRLEREFETDRPNYYFSGLAFLSLMLIATFGFKASAGTLWFYALNLYYVSVVLFYLRRAFSRSEFERYRQTSPHSDRTTWMLRWLPLLVILPTAGWFASSYPLWLKSSAF